MGSRSSTRCSIQDLWDMATATPIAKKESSAAQAAEGLAVLAAAGETAAATAAAAAAAATAAASTAADAAVAAGKKRGSGATDTSGITEGSTHADGGILSAQVTQAPSEGGRSTSGDYAKANVPSGDSTLDTPMESQAVKSALSSSVSDPAGAGGKRTDGVDAPDDAPRSDAVDSATPVDIAARGGGSPATSMAESDLSLNVTPGAASDPAGTASVLATTTTNNSSSSSSAAVSPAGAGVPGTDDTIQEGHSREERSDAGASVPTFPTERRAAVVSGASTAVKEGASGERGTSADPPLLALAASGKTGASASVNFPPNKDVADPSSGQGTAPPPAQAVEDGQQFASSSGDQSEAPRNAMPGRETSAAVPEGKGTDVEGAEGVSTLAKRGDDEALEEVSKGIVQEKGGAPTAVAVAMRYSETAGGEESSASLERPNTSAEDRAASASETATSVPPESVAGKASDVAEEANPAVGTAVSSPMTATAPGEIVKTGTGMGETVATKTAAQERLPADGVPSAGGKVALVAQTKAPAAVVVYPEASSATEDAEMTDAGSSEDKGGVPGTDTAAATAAAAQGPRALSAGVEASAQSDGSPSAPADVEMTDAGPPSAASSPSPLPSPPPPSTGVEKPEKAAGIAVAAASSYSANTHAKLESATQPAGGETAAAVSSAKSAPGQVSAPAAPLVAKLEATEAPAGTGDPTGSSMAGSATAGSNAGAVVVAPRGLVRRDGDSGAACKMCKSKWERDQTLVCCRCLMHYHPGCLDPPMTPKEVRWRRRVREHLPVLPYFRLRSSRLYMAFVCPCPAQVQTCSGINHTAVGYVV